MKYSNFCKLFNEPLHAYKSVYNLGGRVTNLTKMSLFNITSDSYIYKLGQPVLVLCKIYLLFLG